ncbi:hypothetical protein E3Q17_01587 [Wallemia mellicola]|uniref:Valine--tRNA ligase, mitochondrial n=1 Tax=Wallemia mellicola TaxID=1708541 RepID=A0A4T0NWW3_9BASI|nr:hypothetical protein E3Q17_01587 [Wallemia mellicola]
MSTEQPKELTKSAIKKAQKAAEFEAKKAAKAQQQQLWQQQAAQKKERVKPAKEAPVEEAFVNMTPKGDKKDTTKPMASGYNPVAVESAWYDWWEKKGFFKPSLDADGKPIGEVFIVPAPPPNVTGSLHIGHALTISIQDTLVRWNRMQGKTVLWNPGYDHAGISTQSVVEKRLWKSSGQTRHDLGREKFLGKVWDWKEEYQMRISNQLRRLGASYDWDRVRFTMDEKLSKAVIEAFCQLRERGIIYRSNRLVNWCVRMNTALSNLELDSKEISGRTLLNVPGYDEKEKFEFGVLTSFSYQVKGSDEKIIVATTRPETMLGDSAVAVHSSDSRYKHLHGKTLVHPFVDREIPIIVDDICVDPAFGTGAVKITPAHDFNDYEVGKRHNLPFINILNDDGTFNANAGDEFKGVKRFHARRTIVEKLKEIGSYVDTKDNSMVIPICAKSGDVIEPIMKPQWYVNCQDMSREAIERTRAGEMTIQPKHSEGDWYRWLENQQDWCISRQLWWGHRCPAYFVNIEGQEQESSDDKNWVVGRTLEEAKERAEKIANGKPYTLEQDEDVLDTWFSSGLWPFSIMGWPDKTQDMENFYPNSLLETGWDILFFWVARMVFFGITLTGQMPFKEVFTHAMIRDAHGRKMSKSLGNVIDPIDVIEGCELDALHQQLYDSNLDPREVKKALDGQKKDFPKGIPQCGTDALRFTLCAYTASNRDINLEISKVESNRKFCNKLFNATKFAMLKFPEGWTPAASAKPTGDESLVERWILSKLNYCAKQLDQDLTNRNFMSATQVIYNYWLYELCDVFIEASKPLTAEDADEKSRRSAQNTLYTALDAGLKMMHVFMPYVTEELWQHLPRRPNDNAESISLTEFPKADPAFEFTQEAKDFETAYGAIKATRSLATAYNVQGNNIQAYIETTEEKAPIFKSQLAVLKTLIKGCKVLEVVTTSSEIPVGCAVQSINVDANLHVLVRGLVDIDAELTKLEKKEKAAKMTLEKTIKATQIDGYAEKVSVQVQQNNQEKIQNYEKEIEALTSAMKTFASLNLISQKLAKNWAPSLALWGVGIGSFGSFFLSPVPKFKEDVLQKVPFLGGFYNQETPDTDKAF